MASPQAQRATGAPFLGNQGTQHASGMDVIQKIKAIF